MRPLSELLVDHVIPWPELPWPLDLDAIFGRRAPLLVEIGFGDGAFLERLATTRTDLNLIGIELSWEPIGWCFKRVEKARHPALRIMRADAHLVLERVLPAGSVHEFVINHPDPWPKEKHHGRRLIQVEFLKRLAECLEPDGRVTIATDHEDYAHWIDRELRGQDALAPEGSARYVHELPGRLVTRYQRKAQSIGIRNYFFVWRKTAAAAPERPRLEPGPMPNVTFEGAHDGSRLLEGFQPRVFRERIDGVDVTIHFERTWRSADARQWLVEAVVIDGRYTQQIALLAQTPEPGRLLVKTAAIGYPRATDGVKKGVWYLARMLRSAWPELRVLSTTVGSLD